MLARRRLGYGNLGSLNLRSEFGFYGRFRGSLGNLLKICWSFMRSARYTTAAEAIASVLPGLANSSHEGATPKVLEANALCPK